MNIFELVIVQPIFNLLVLLYSLIPGGDFGIAIIIFTAIVRLALWPLVRRQLHQVKKMRKLQPKLAQIRKNAKGNKQLESMQMMELYKEHGVSPFRSIITMIIQLPIFISLYQVIQIFTIHRDQIGKFTYNFLEHIGPIHNLVTNPKNFNEHLFGFINLTQHALGGFTLSTVFLFLIAGAASFLQYKMAQQTAPATSGKRLRDIMTEATDGKQADQAELNAVVMGKMTKVLPLFTFLIMINLPGALALYYAVSNLVGFIQQSIILREDEEEMEELAEKTPAGSHKKATAKAAAKVRAEQAQEGHVTRIVAKDTRK